MSTSNFFQRSTISSTSYNTSPDGYWNTGNTSLSLINEGTVTISYSFDGVTTNGDLVPGTPSSAQAFNNRGYSAVWFKVASGSSVVRIEACAGTIDIAGLAGGTSSNPIITSLAGIAGVDGYSAGSLTAQNQYVSISTQGCQSCSIVLTTSGWSGQVTFQQQPAPNAAWLDDYAISEAGIVAGAYGYQTTAAGVWIASVGGYYAYRVLCNIWSSGTMNVSMDAAVGVNTATDTTLITDMSSHGPAAVKNASTAAVASDPALVVSLSPNSPIVGWTGSATVPLLASASGVLSCNIANDGYSTLPVGGIYNGSSNPGISVGVLSPLALDGYSNLQVTSNTLLAGENLSLGGSIGRMVNCPTYNYTNITSSTLIHTGNGVLHSIVLNSVAATATIQLADNTSGTTPAICGIWTPGAIVIPQAIVLDVAFSTGLYVTIGTAAANITVCWIS